MSFSSQVLTLEVNGHIATLWLDRPEKRNAMSREMVADIPRAMEAIAAVDDLRAVVIAGRGKSFCVGIDLADLGGGSANKSGEAKVSGATASLKQISVTRAFQASISSISECQVPVIAAIHSHCLGAGIDLATACDIRIASEDASFGVRETRIGIVADVGTL